MRTLLLLALLFSAASCTQRPSDNEPVELRLTADNYVVIPTGNPEKHIKYRVSFASNTIYLYYQSAESSGSRTWNLLTRYTDGAPQEYYTEILYPGKLRLRLPVTYSGYAYYTDEDPSETGGRISHQGVLGMGVASPLKLYWRRYSFSRHRLVLGDFSHDDQDSKLPFVFERGTSFAAEVDMGSVAGDAHTSQILKFYSRHTNASANCRVTDSNRTVCSYIVIFDPSTEKTVMPHELIGHYNDARNFIVKVYSQTNDPYEYRTWDEAIVEALCGAYVVGSDSRLNSNECKEKAWRDIQLRVEKYDSSFGFQVDTTQTIRDDRSKHTRIFTSEAGLEGDAARTIRVGRLSMRDFVYFRDEDRDFTIVAHAYDSNFRAPVSILAWFITLASVIYCFWYVGAYPYTHTVSALGALTGTRGSALRDYYTVGFDDPKPPVAFAKHEHDAAGVYSVKPTGANPEDFYAETNEEEEIHLARTSQIEKRMRHRIRDILSTDNEGTLIWFSEIWKTLVVLTIFIAIFGTRVDRFLDRISGVYPVGSGFWPVFGFYVVPTMLYAYCAGTSYLSIQAYPLFFISSISASVCICACYYLFPTHKALESSVAIYFFSVLACARVADYLLPLALDKAGFHRIELYNRSRTEYVLWLTIGSVHVIIIACFYSYFGVQTLFDEFWPSHPSMPFIIIANLLIAWLAPSTFYYCEERFSFVCALLHRTKDVAKKQLQREQQKRNRDSGAPLVAPAASQEKIPTRRITAGIDSARTRRTVLALSEGTNDGWLGVNWTQQ
jgi:hypothetical protein